MNKKDSDEIRDSIARNTATDERGITKIYGCYVNEKREKECVFCENGSDLPEEEYDRYVELFDNSLSGSYGKHLVNISFSQTDENPERISAIKMNLVELSGCLDTDMVSVDEDKSEELEKLYDRIIASYHPEEMKKKSPERTVEKENYIILVATGEHDIPVRSVDNKRRLKRSESKLNYCFAIICPVPVRNYGLIYSNEEKNFRTRIKDWEVEKPERGFFYPGYTRGEICEKEALYYSKSLKDFYGDFLLSAFGCIVPSTQPEQQSAFSELVRDALGDGLSVDTVKRIGEEINNYRLEAKDDEGEKPEEISAEELFEVLKRVGASPDAEYDFTEKFKECFPENKVRYSNIIGRGALNINSEHIIIKSKKGGESLITQITHAGRKGIFIAMESGTSVNGLCIA